MTWKGQLDLIALRNKIPPLHEILTLYATIVFLIYGWAITTFFWAVPSWLYFLSLGEIAAILSYTLASSLMECTILLLLFLFASLVLPSNWLYNKFAVRGSLFIYSLTFWVVLFTLNSLIQLPTTSDVITFGVGVLVTSALAILLAERISFFPRLVTTVGNRLTIFLYLWLPLSLLGILVIVFRILGGLNK
jgi:hypothetical protein